MTREEFIKVLDGSGYSYRKEGEKIVVTGSIRPGNVWLDGITSIPSGVVFDNLGQVSLGSMDKIPDDIVFTNGGEVFLDRLKTISSDTIFNNKKDIYLPSLRSIPSGLQFKNKDGVSLLFLIGGFFDTWSGNIEGIRHQRLLNKMISLGLFDR
jgi:hypothetical protein